MEHKDLRGQDIHIGDAVKFRDRGQDAYGKVTGLEEYNGNPAVEVTEEGTSGPYLFYAWAVQVVKP